MQPQVSHNMANGSSQEPLRNDAEGPLAFAEWTDSHGGGGEMHTEGESAEWTDEQSAEIDALDKASEADLLAMAGIEPIVSTTEAAEYFDRTTQWIYWGLKPDEKTGEHVFVWPDGSPIVPDRVGDSVNGRRRFTMPILRAILTSSYRRGNIDPGELKTVIRRIRYTELGVEWREREGWKYVDLGRNRHRWVRPDRAYYDHKTKAWKLRKGEEFEDE